MAALCHVGMSGRETRVLQQNVDIAALRAWMDAQGLGNGPIEEEKLLAGGTQNILLRFTRAGRDYVLRRPPQHPRPESNRTMLREARLLKALAGSDVPHPGFIALCGDESVLGAVFYLMEPVEGFNPVAGLPPLHAGSAEVQHAMGLSVVDGIAALGALDHEALGLGDFGRAEGFLERQVERWKAQLDSYAGFEGWEGPADTPVAAAMLNARYLRIADGPDEVHLSQLGKQKIAEYAGANQQR